MLPTVQLKNMGLKHCRKCEADKPLEAFYRHKDTLDGRAGWCRECLSTKWKVWYQANKEKADIRSKQWYRENKEKVSQKNRDRDLKINFGMTRQDYNRLFQIQGGTCAICKIHQMQVNKNLRVDHCHETNKIRGLLCHNCNVSLGLLRESIPTLKAMIEYLEKV